MLDELYRSLIFFRNRRILISIFISFSVFLTYCDYFLDFFFQFLRRNYRNFKIEIRLESTKVQNYLYHRSCEIFLEDRRLFNLLNLFKMSVYFYLGKKCNRTSNYEYISINVSHNFLPDFVKIIKKKKKSGDKRSNLCTARKKTTITRWRVQS